MSRSLLALVAVLVVMAVAMLSIAPGAEAASYVVDTTSDTSLTGCTGAADDCSLRGAITNANSTGGTDTITFAIGSGTQTIAVTSVLPTISQAVVIDGTTQPGFAGTPIIELDGTGAGASAYGLNIGGGGSTIRGLVINRFANHGIYLQSGDANIIAGNYIGTDVTGALDLGNTQRGINIDVASLNNTIGGSAPADRNVISGSGNEGIFVANTSTGQTIKGNYIGLNAAGSGALGNSLNGITINSAGNTIGGISVGEGNVVSGNFGGMSINAVSTVKGNLIGTDATGTVDLGNANAGIFASATNLTIGGPEAGARNVISGNNTIGVQVLAASVTIQGNYIGTDITGTADLGNTSRGILITTANNTVGGAGAGEGNVISGNNGNGVELNGTGATGNTVNGNIIGLNAAGTADLGNTLGGVLITGGPTGNFIGDTSAGARNVISGNDTAGVSITSLASTGNAVRGNYIGTNAAGNAGIPNTTGGVLVSGSSNTIGGSVAGSVNVISGNTSHGIRINNGTSGNNVFGNLIGIAADGTTALGNSGAGVVVEANASSTIIGRQGATGAANTIANNLDDGIQILTGTGNFVGINSITANNGLGIDLGTSGVTANDAGTPPDTDTGANNLQNFPVLTSAFSSGQLASVGFTLSSTPSTTFNLRFFANASCDSSGNGEGAVPIEQHVPATTDVSGTVSSTVVLLSTVSAGQFITAVVTDPSFNTSEFSACATVAADPDIDDDSVADGGDNCPAWPNPAQTLPTWTIPADDPDCDGFNTDREHYTGTDPAKHCPDTAGANNEPVDAWPTDFNDSQLTGLADVVLMGPVYNQSTGNDQAKRRFDLNASGIVSLADVVLMGPFYNKSCA